MQEPHQLFQVVLMVEQEQLTLEVVEVELHLQLVHHHLLMVEQVAQV